MPDWKSPAELQKDAAAFVKLIHVLLGVYACVFFSPYASTIWPDCDPKIRMVSFFKVRFQFFVGKEEIPLANGCTSLHHTPWTLLIIVQIFYFANRYLLLFALVGM